MNDSKSDSVTTKLVRDMFWRSLRNILIGGLILAIIWGILGWFIPEGWPILIVNVICLLLSIGFGWTMTMALRLVLPLWLSAIVSALLWILLFGIIQGLF